MTLPKLGLVGFFGWGNFGDELFLRAHRQHLSGVADLVQLNDLTVKPYFSQPLDRVIDSVDGFVIGGGDLMIPWQVSELYWKLEYLQKPVFVVGVGVPTWGGSKPAAIEHYRRFLAHPNVKLVLARDPESVAWINSNVAPAVEAQFAPDLVCAMSLPKAQKKEARTFGLVLRQRKSSDDFSKVRELCDRAAAYGYTVKHIVLANMETGERDYAVAAEFARDGEEIVRSESLDEMCQAISSCEMIASMKFHGTVVATMYGVPSIVLSPTDKSRNFLRLIQRPDLQGSFGAVDLPDRLPHFPAPIPSHTRSYLRRAATGGYDLLRERILQEFRAAAA